MYFFRPSKVPDLVKEMLGHNIVTKQTSKKGVTVRKVLFSVSSIFYYLGVKNSSFEINVKGINFSEVKFKQ